jgi:hypothetical protein
MVGSQKDPAIPGTSNGRERLLQIDEASQMISHDGRDLSKTYTGKGHAAKSISTTNRDSVSFAPMADAAAHLYKSQVLAKGAGLREALCSVTGKNTYADIPGVDEAGLQGNGVRAQCSFFYANCLISITEKAMQTDKSLSDRLLLLISEVRERGVELPVIIITDGHSSRMGELTGKALSKFVLRMWLDMGDISNWRQMWDQLFQGFHAEYERIRKHLTLGSRGKTALPGSRDRRPQPEDVDKRHMPMNIQTILQIFDLMFGLHGPRLCTVGMIFSSWRICGITWFGIAFDFIPARVYVGDRLHDQGDSTDNLFNGFTEDDLTPTYTRVGMREGSAERCCAKRR